MVIDEMPRRMDQLQFRVLEVLAESPNPEGAGSLVRRLSARGFHGSQATLGRALRVLDERGYTLRLSNKGRVLTPSGRHWLAGARHRQETHRWTQDTLTAVGQSTLTELRHSMVARLALERAIARLAAENASPSEIAELGRIIAGHRDDLAGGGRGAEEAVEFHVALAKACGNRFLASAAELVRTSSEALENLMYHLGATVGGSYGEHIEVVQAIATRNPDAAERAMVTHLDELIRQIDLLLSRLSGGASRPAADGSDDGEPRRNKKGAGAGRAVRPAGSPLGE